MKEVTLILAPPVSAMAIFSKLSTLQGASADAVLHARAASPGSHFAAVTMEMWVMQRWQKEEGETCGWWRSERTAGRLAEVKRAINSHYIWVTGMLQLQHADKTLLCKRRGSHGHRGGAGQ